MTVSSELPPVGAPATEPAGNGKDEAWWSDEQNAPEAPPETRPKKKGRGDSTAEEEMQRFRHVPVMGQWPWRRQYLIATFGLIVGVLVMLQQAMSQSHADGAITAQMGADLALRQSLQTLNDQAQAGRRGVGLDTAALNGALSGGQLALQQLGEQDPGLAQAWTHLQQTTQALPGQVASGVPVVQAARQVQTSLDAILPTTATASALNPVTSAMQQAFADWAEGTRSLVNEGRPLGVGLGPDRTYLEAQLRAFYASPEAQVQDARKALWDTYLRAFGETKGAMDQVLASQRAWQSAAAATWQVEGATHQIADRLAQTAGARRIAWDRARGAHTGVWLSGLFTALCLGLLTFISWKQQRWQALQARVTAEKMEAGIFDLQQQLGQIARGDLTVRSKADEPAVAAVAEAINHTVDDLSALARRVRSTVDRTKEVAQSAVHATGALAEESRQHAQDMRKNGQEVLRILAAFQSLNREAERAAELTVQTTQAATAGSQAVGEAREALRDSRGRTEEALTKVRRLSEGNRESASEAVALFDFAERMVVLSVQAALHAERAGEPGRGFAIVARGMRHLAEQAKQSAERVGALVETAQADIEGTAAAIASGTSQTDESARLNDVAHEAWSDVESRLRRLSDMVAALATEAQEQEPIAQALEGRTREGLEQGERTRQHAQRAGETVGQLIEVVHELGESVQRFRTS
jgi:methyl-accepting chemotaxis protein